MASSSATRVQGFEALRNLVKSSSDELHTILACRCPRQSSRWRAPRTCACQRRELALAESEWCSLLYAQLLRGSSPPSWKEASAGNQIHQMVCETSVIPILGMRGVPRARVESGRSDTKTCSRSSLPPESKRGRSVGNIGTDAETPGDDAA